jgi:hypothetical protein
MLPPPRSESNVVCTDLSLPRGVRFADLTGYAERPTRKGFANAFHLVEVRIPDDWEELPIDFFSGDACLQRVLFGDGSRLRPIQAYAFRDCASLTRLDPLQPDHRGGLGVPGLRAD